MYHGWGGAGGVWSVGRPVNHHPPELSLVSQSRRAASQMLPKPAFVVDGGDTKNCFPFIIFDNRRKYTETTSSRGYCHSKLGGYLPVLPFANKLLYWAILFTGGQDQSLKKDLKSITLLLADNNVRR